MHIFIATLLKSTIAMLFLVQFSNKYNTDLRYGKQNHTVKSLLINNLRWTCKCCAR